MYRQKWAGIVYGRSYHLDFRFIAIPKDFTSQELDWASPYILATTRKAGKLPSHPRWSLFKNDSHCILGVTCMVRDLIGELDENSAEELTTSKQTRGRRPRIPQGRAYKDARLPRVTAPPFMNSVASPKGGVPWTKDDRGRPLYVFVGYVTKLEHKKCLFNLPSYLGNCLEDFQSLYQYVREVWLVKNFDKQSRKPRLTDYQTLTFTNQQVQSNCAMDFIEELNYHGRHSDKVFLWQNTPEQNRKLWTASAIFPEPTSVCLGINSRHYLNSPFLNQTISELEQFTIQDRIPIPPQPTTHLDTTKKRSFAQFIAHKAREDINLTLQQAAQAVNLGQELLDNFTDRPNQKKLETRDRIEVTGDREHSTPALESSLIETKDKDTENFGFKSKPYTKPATQAQDWF